MHLQFGTNELMKRIDLFNSRVSFIVLIGNFSRLVCCVYRVRRRIVNCTYYEWFLLELFFSCVSRFCIKSYKYVSLNIKINFSRSISYVYWAERGIINCILRLLFP